MGPQGLGVQHGTQIPCFLGRTSVVLTILYWWVTCLLIWVLTIVHICPSYLSYYDSFFISWVVKTFSDSLQVTFMDSCSINNYNFGVNAPGMRWVQGLLTLPSWPLPSVVLFKKVFQYLKSQKRVSGMVVCWRDLDWINLYNEKRATIQCSSWCLSAPRIIFLQKVP